MVCKQMQLGLPGVKEDAIASGEENVGQGKESLKKWLNCGMYTMKTEILQER